MVESQKRELGIGAATIRKVRHTSRGHGERMTTETRTNQPAVAEGIPVEMVPTTAREHITGFAALNIPHAWRLGGDWHQSLV